jgi:polyphenol oxidase
LSDESGVEWHLRYLRLQGFAECHLLVHGFSTRRGGISGPPFSSLNLSFEVGDVVEAVRANRRLLLEDLGIEAKPLVQAKQVHGDGILVIGEETAARPDFPEVVQSIAADALITALPGVALAVSVADCVPLLVLDRTNRIAAAIHGGWRSTAASLASKVVRKMEEIFGTRPEDLVVGIGPSIGPCCYEVDEPVLSAFMNLSLRSLEWVREGDGGRWHLDLAKANRSLLLEAGVPQGQIFSSGICSSCQRELFFSHRRDRGQTGRMMGVIMMEEAHG